LPGVFVGPVATPLDALPFRCRPTMLPFDSLETPSELFLESVAVAPLSFVDVGDGCCFCEDVRSGTRNEPRSVINSLLSSAARPSFSVAMFCNSCTLPCLPRPIADKWRLGSASVRLESLLIQSQPSLPVANKDDRQRLCLKANNIETLNWRSLGMIPTKRKSVVVDRATGLARGLVQGTWLTVPSPVARERLISPGL
jgi:hypothetical protein